MLLGPFVMWGFSHSGRGGETSYVSSHVRPLMNVGRCQQLSTKRKWKPMLAINAERLSQPEKFTQAVMSLAQKPFPPIIQRSATNKQEPELSANRMHPDFTPDKFPA